MFIGSTKGKKAAYNTTYEALKGLSKMKSDLIKIQRDLDAHTDNKIKTNKIKSAIDSTWKEVTRKLDSLM